MAEMRCFEDLDAFGAETVDELEDLAQDLFHRLIEPLGSNLDDPNRGLGIEEMLSGPVDSGLKTRIEEELRKDPRVTAALALITEIETGRFRIEIRVQPDEGELGFALESDASGAVRRVA